MQAADLAVAGLVIAAPIAIVMLVAMLRGYTISIRFTREDKNR